MNFLLNFFKNNNFIELKDNNFNEDNIYLNENINENINEDLNENINENIYNIDNELYKNYALISTNSNMDLTQKIYNICKIPIIRCELEYFANGEIRPKIYNSIRGKYIYIIASPNSINDDYKSINDHLIEIYLLIKTCKRADVANITLICPYFPYCRQDKKDNPRGALSARDIADLFSIAGINRIVCMDLHAEQIQGFFNIPCDNLNSINIIKNYLDEHYLNFNNKYNEYKFNKEIKILNNTTDLINNTDLFNNKYLCNYVLIAPDEGALKRVQKYAYKLELPFMVISKERDYNKLNEINVEKSILIGNKKLLQNKIAIIMDDIIDTGNTIINVANLLVKKGAKYCIVIATHGIFSNCALYKLNLCNNIREIIVSNSLSQNLNLIESKKLKIFDISNLINDVIMRLVDNKSISELFN